MEKRRLGRAGPEVSAIGLGCMGMSFAYGPADRGESERTLNRAVDLGINFFDTADMYGFGDNERLLGEVFRGRWKGIFLATKFGFVVRDGERGFDASPNHVREACDASLQRLGIETIDLYYSHRVDPKVPIEDTVGAMAELVKQGKVRFLGLSEASSESLRRASKVHAITALQSEYSLWTRDPEEGPLQTARDLGVGFVPYSPLGRGFLTGQIRNPNDFSDDDFRKGNPRFQGENFQKNLELVSVVEQIAREKSATASQVALAWVLAQGEDIVPIPGTKHVRYLEENVGALNVSLTRNDLERLNGLTAAGERYAPQGMEMVNR